MHATFSIVWNLVFGLIGCIIPFVAVFRGRRFIRVVLLAWIALLVFVSFSCFALPPIVGHFDSAAERRLYDSGFDGPFIFATMVLGWFYPLVAASLGFGVRQLWRRFYARH